MILPYLTRTHVGVVATRSPVSARPQSRHGMQRADVHGTVRTDIDQPDAAGEIPQEALGRDNARRRLCIEANPQQVTSLFGCHQHVVAERGNEIALVERQRRRRIT